ncbi:MAG: hypothetical protein PHP39_08205 [Oscillospiraceae bacterium]|nr:hypothetical protein [Oscillospiraceae bacterium]
MNDEGIDLTTVAAYLNIFRRLFITDNQPLFVKKIRSSIRVKQQDYAGCEIDAVIKLPNGQWCAFEIKLGASQIDAAGKYPG